jgi:alpha-glucosidase (family GH31 glycosyl hydrolase)
VFKDQFIELSTAVPADADLYGLGETTLRTGLLLPRDGTVMTLWNRDLSPAEPNFNLYGSHPFYLQVNKGRHWFAAETASVPEELMALCMMLYHVRDDLA